MCASLLELPGVKGRTSALEKSFTESQRDGQLISEQSPSGYILSSADGIMQPQTRVPPIVDDFDRESGAQ
jgi:hypothetical protein